jgi:hypothetical protein
MKERGHAIESNKFYPEMFDKCPFVTLKASTLFPVIPIYAAIVSHGCRP